MYISQHCFGWKHWYKWYSPTFSIYQRCYKNLTLCLIILLSIRKTFSQALGFGDIMKKVVQSVNFTRSWALQAMLDELDSKYGDFYVYFSNVHWLSWTVTLKRFWDLKIEILNLWKRKNKMSPFSIRDFWLTLHF